MALPSEILASTLEKRTGKVQDNVTNHNILAQQMKEHDMIETGVSGRSLYEELNFAENGSFTRYTAAQTLPLTNNQVLTVAEFEPKQFAVAVVIHGKEKRQNSGKEGIIKLLKNRIKVADATLENNFNADMFSDGTADGGLQIGGLRLLIAKAPTSGTVGGIDRAVATNAFWRNYKFDTAADWAGGALNGSNVEELYGRVMDNTQQGSNGAKFVVAGKTHYGFVRAAAQAKQMITDSKLAKFGFRNIVFCEMPVVLGSSINFGGQTLIPDDLSYFIDPKGIALKVYTGAYMEPLKQIQSITQDAEAQLIIFMGNMTMNRAKTQAVLFDS